jgi:hypothetical protein
MLQELLLDVEKVKFGKMKNSLRKIIKEELFINESFDKPFNNISKIDDFTYTCGDEKPLVKFTIRPYYKKIDCEEYLLNKIDSKIYEISWDWVYGVGEKEKTTSNWVKATTSSIKVIDQFNRDLKPNIILFNETENTQVIYRGFNFIEKIRTIFGDNFLVCSNHNEELDVNRVYLIKKELSTYGLDKIEKMNEQCDLGVDVIRERALKPKKRDLKGIKRKLFKETQLKRVALKTIYL